MSTQESEIKSGRAPWRISRDVGPDDEFCFHSIYDADNNCISSTWAPDNEKQGMRDANLIAAAPEMLIALQAVDREATMMGFDDALARLVRDVIAKATGGQ